MSSESENADVDADPELQAEYGDRVPVVLLDGREHSYFTVEVPRLRRDLGVNFAGAHVIIELIEQIEELKRTRRAPSGEPMIEE